MGVDFLRRKKWIMPRVRVITALMLVAMVYQATVQRVFLAVALMFLGAMWQTTFLDQDGNMSGNKTVRSRKIAGVVYGTALGDALGYPVEFESNPKVTEDSIPRLYSDDTQMFRAVCEGLLTSQTISDLEVAAAHVAKELVIWMDSPENNRSPGNACMLGCHNLAKGIPWREAGKLNGGGCGAAMRSMAYGIWFSDPATAGVWAAEHALMTHRSPSGQASAAAVAAIVSSLIGGASPVQAVEIGSTMASYFSFFTADLILHCAKLAGNATPENTRELLDKWRGWTGDEAVAVSVFCFLAFPQDFSKAVLTAVNSPGDSDSLGAITGSFSGSYLGSEAIPERWKKTVEKSGQLRDLAIRLDNQSR